MASPQESIPLRWYARTTPPPAGAYDELLDGAGTVRPPWRTFVDHLDALGAEALAARWREARHLIRENGVSFNVHGDPEGMQRPWQLSPVPVLLGAADFAALSAGLAQRARLLDRLLADLYGPQRALLEGWLPPDLVLGHPGYLRPCQGLRQPHGRFLHLYAADVVRTRAGGFQVLVDRTQAPAGAGYALENRLVVSRVLPEPFRACNVERLALFFRGVRQTLESLAPEGRENPRIVLLSPGPYSATAFEQAFLAQYLGYTLVEGADLAVRDGRVFLKTLGGLHRIDVILRRLNDDHCDPLELRPESALGVAGLMQAVRDGQVAVANALGSGLLQTPALMPFLPALCRGLLGEELTLPSVETFWCGEPASLQHVLANLHQMVVKPAYPSAPAQPIFADALEPEARAALAERLRASPARWVAQACVPLSTTPLLDGDGFAPRALVLRSFLVTTPGGAGDAPAAYQAMPGALALVAGADGARDVSMQAGAGSKDTWVIGDGPVSSYTLLPPPGEAVALSRGGSDLPSRVADNLFWLGRYAERADAIARVGRVIAARLPDRAAAETPGEVGLLLHAMRVQTRTAAGGLAAVPAASTTPDGIAVDGSAGADALLAAALGDESHPGTLRATLRAAHRVARAIRDRITQDIWRMVTALDEEARALQSVPAPGRGVRHASLSALDRIVALSAALSGLVTENMTRGLAWRFIDMGRRLERAANVTLVLRETVGRAAPREQAVLEALLEMADSSITYRRRYRASLQAAPVVDLLLADDTNPRAVAFQLAAVGEHLAALSPDGGGTGPRQSEQLLRGIVDALAAADVTRACVVVPAAGAEGGDGGGEAAGARPALVALLDQILRTLPAIADAVSSSYLTHATLARQLSDPSAGGAP